MPNKEKPFKHFEVFLVLITELEDLLNKIHAEKYNVVQVQPTGRKENEINEMAIVAIAPPTEKMILEAAAKQYGIPVEKIRMNKAGQLEVIKDDPPKKAKGDLKLVKKDKPEEKK